jgi:hypothetical protein
MSYYKNIYTDEVINERDYHRLEDYEQDDYSRISERNSTGDFITSAAIGAVTDSALLGGLLGGDLLGGMLGDMLDGDLMD